MKARKLVGLDKPLIQIDGSEIREPTLTLQRVVEVLREEGNSDLLKKFDDVCKEIAESLGDRLSKPMTLRKVLVLAAQSSLDGRMDDRLKFWGLGERINAEKKDTFILSPDEYTMLQGGAKAVLERMLNLMAVPTWRALTESSVEVDLEEAKKSK